MGGERTPFLVKFRLFLIFRYTTCLQRDVQRTQIACLRLIRYILHRCIKKYSPFCLIFDRLAQYENVKCLINLILVLEGILGSCLKQFSRTSH